MNPAFNLVLVGPMGSGKTTIGKRLARRFGLRFVDTDQAIEACTGTSVSMIFEIEGEAGFRRREEQAIEQLCRGRHQLIATGGGAVLSERNREQLNRHGFVVWLRTSVERQLERLSHDRTRPLLQQGNRRHKLRDLAQHRDPLYASVCDLVFDSDQRKATLAAERLGDILEQRWHRDEAAA